MISCNLAAPALPPVTTTTEQALPRARAGVELRPLPGRLSQGKLSGREAVPAGAALGPSRPPNLPRVQQLAALGVVLCLYRPQDGSELSGWARAVHVESLAVLDSGGLRESLSFFDVEGCCCWRLHLLPESDFLAWDHMIEALPARIGRRSEGPLGQRLWRRLAASMRGGQWHACSIRLHALATGSLEPLLAASLTPLSSPGLDAARRIARAEAAQDSIRMDAYCVPR